MDDELGKNDGKDEEESITRQETSEIRSETTIPEESSKRIQKYDIPKTHGAVEDPRASQCTVKEILDEILDCQVVRHTKNQRQECKQDKTKTNQATSSISQDVENGGASKVLTVKQILGEVLNYSVCRQTVPVDFCEAGPSSCRRTDFRVFRAGVVNSSDVLHGESLISTPAKLLPSYSSVLRMGPKKRASSLEIFPPRVPPPSYAEVEGLWDAGVSSPSAVSSESAILGPDPLYLVCPICRTVVVTDVERERSSATHVLALVLCLLLCWPCCLLPYCMHSCSYSYHSCPNCRHYFGMYRPPF